MLIDLLVLGGWAEATVAIGPFFALWSLVGRLGLLELSQVALWWMVHLIGRQRRRAHPFLP